MMFVNTSGSHSFWRYDRASKILTGRLIFSRSSLPVSSFLPISFMISTTADFCRSITPLSVQRMPPSGAASGCSDASTQS